MKIKFFLVFHQTIDARLSLNTFSLDELSNWFFYYAVNDAKKEKKIYHLNGDCIDLSKDEINLNQGANGPNSPNLLCEWLLPMHDESLQRQGFMETSCFIHLFLNKLYEGVDYIGVSQYDMRWTNKSAKVIRKLGNLKKYDNPKSLVGKLKNFFGFAIYENTVYAQISGKLLDKEDGFNVMASTDHFDWNYLLKSYNNFFQSNWKFGDLTDQPLSLWQTYLMPRKFFCELAEWLISLSAEVAPWANKPPYQTHWGVLGGYTERAECLYMAIKNKAGEIHLRQLSLDHDEQISLGLKISKDHYGVQ